METEEPKLIIDKAMITDGVYSGPSLEDFKGHVHIGEDIDTICFEHNVKVSGRIHAPNTMIVAMGSVNPSLSLRGRSLSVGGDFTCSAAEIRNSLNVDGDIVAEGGLSAGWMVRCENFKGLRLHGGWGVDIKENIDVKDHINAGCGLRVGGHVYVSSDIGWVNAEHAIYVGGDLMATAIRAGRSVHAKTISCRRVMAGASVSLPLREEHKQIRAILLSGEVQLGKLIDAQCEQQDRTGERIMILDNQRYRLTPVTS